MYVRTNCRNVRHTDKMSLLVSDIMIRSNRRAAIYRLAGSIEIFRIRPDDRGIVFYVNPRVKYCVIHAGRHVQPAGNVRLSLS